MRRHSRLLADPCTKCIQYNARKASKCVDKIREDLFYLQLRRLNTHIRALDNVLMMREIFTGEVKDRQLRKNMIIQLKQFAACKDSV